MKRNIWRQWNLGREINIGTTGSMPIILFYIIIASWLFTISLVISMLVAVN